MTLMEKYEKATGFAPDYGLIPLHMREGMLTYLLYGTRPGDFLSAILKNDLHEAFVYSDEINKPQLLHYIEFLHAHAPVGSWGSPACVDYWIKQGGLGADHVN